MAALRQARASLLNCVVLHNNPTDVMVLDCPLSCALPNTFSQIHQKEFIWILTIYKPNWSVIFLALHCSRRIKTRLASVLKQFSTRELIFLPCDAQHGLPISIVHPHNFPRLKVHQEERRFLFPQGQISVLSIYSLLQFNALPWILTNRIRGQVNETKWKDTPRPESMALTQATACASATTTQQASSCS